MSTSIAPLSSYLALASVKHKLEGFRYFRATIHLKFILNSSPYHFGKVIAAWRPLGSLEPPSVSADGYSVVTTSGPHIDSTPTAGFKFMATSNLPHIELYPTQSEGATITIPYFSPYPYLRLSSASTDADSLGILYVHSLGELRVASAATSQVTKITVFAHLSDVELMGPSYVPQSKLPEVDPLTSIQVARLLLIRRNDVERGIIQLDGSALERAQIFSLSYQSISTALDTVSAVSGAAAGIFRAVGMCSEPALAPVTVVVNRRMPGVSSIERDVGVEALTLSGDQPGMTRERAGAGETDELDIASLGARETYAYSADWTTSLSADTVLLKGVVSPELANMVSYSTVRAGTAYKAMLSPACHASYLFEKWRGTLVYRFEVIASSFHRGRLRFAYDATTIPSAYGSTLIDGLTFQRIFDISETSNFVVKVPFMARTQCLKTSGWYGLSSANSGIIGGSASSIAFDAAYHAGGWSLTVLNELGGPGDSTSGVYVLCYISVEDFELFDPIEPFTNMASYFDHYNTQSLEPDPTQGDSETYVVPRVGKINLKDYFGEQVKSIRALLMRMSFYAPLDADSLAPTMVCPGYKSHVLPRFPLQFGPTRPSNAALLDTGEVTTLTWGNDYLHKTAPLAAPVKAYYYNYVRSSPLTHMTPCFAGRVGSIDWAMSLPPPAGSTWRSGAGAGVETGYSAGNVINFGWIARSHNTSRGIASNFVPTGASTMSTFARNAILGTPGTAPGATVISAGETGIARVPPQSHLLFQSTSVQQSRNADRLDWYDDNVEFMYHARVLNDLSAKGSTGIHLFCRAAPDFNLLMYLYPPVMYFTSGALPASTLTSVT